MSLAFNSSFKKVNQVGFRRMASYTKLEANFIKPDLDDRSYRYIQLPNDLKALLIQDPSADKAAAALDVNVGAFEDPEELPGLAHFCEHLLFMGSKRFPDENEYSSYLSKHGGSSNAYTGSRNTNYYFEINHEHLKGALDRFSGFFTGPLFNKDSTDKEIRAVDSENKKNLQSDLWRLYQLDKSLTNVKHPYHKFSTGNFITLHEVPESRGIDVREELLKFYKRCYSSNLMKLCILGREDLDTLSDWACALFQDVPNTGRGVPEYDARILDEHSLQKVIQAKSVKDLKKLEVTFAVPDMEHQWESKPHHILSHLVGHEGSGSLLAYLKAKGWANELSAGGHSVSSGNAFFSIDIDLTDNGLKHYEEVVHILFQYIEMLKLSLPEKWIYLELEDIARADFKFKQKRSPSETVSSLAKQLEKSYIPVANILSTELFRKYDPDLLMEYLNHLTPRNSRIMLASKDMETDTKEQWYGTEYKVLNYSQKLGKIIQDPGLDPHLHLPRPNEFIATNFRVEKTDQFVPLEEPLLLKDDKNSKLWYKKDDRFWQPRGYIYVTLKLPHTQSSIICSMLSTLYVHLINDHVKDLQYDAACSNLHLNFSKTNQGLDITVIGFNDKLTILLTRFLEGLKTFMPNKSKFQMFKDKCTRQLTNQLYEIPYLQIFPVYSSLINERTWSIKEKLEVLKRLTFEQLASFVPSIYEEMFFEVLVHGNMRYEEAMEVDSLVQTLVPSDIKNYQAKNGRLRSYFLPQGETFRFETHLVDPKNLNSCIQHVTQLGVYDECLSSKASLFAQMIHEPCFDTLRTKEQLGYVVFSSNLNNHGTANLRILVQSEHTTPFLEWRIDNFLHSFGSTLRNMSDKDFEGHKDALCKSLTQKYKNMREESSRYASAIYLGDYNFTHRQRKAHLVSQLTKVELTDFYDDLIVGPNSSRMVLHLKSQVSSDKLDESSLDKAKYPQGTLITDVGEFKSKLFAAPVRQPTKKFEIFTPKL
ncbi:STE23 (YLR389C) [Zygosaccharomyces parabailii]|nr:STE23 (YLR389C) [Zygosaccharomyces parabailii]CDH10946.1 probable A-factor-processing enzyme [Zygosaccharomyces bailii ISA1307]